MDVSLSEQIKWRYYCTVSDNVKLKNLKAMILSSKGVSDGYEIILNVAGSKKDDIVITAKPSGRLTVKIQANELFSERNYYWTAGTVYDVVKAKSKLENGLLTINIPYKDKMSDVKITVD